MLKRNEKVSEPFRVQAGTAFVLSNDEMIDMVERGEAKRLANEDTWVAQKAAKVAKLEKKKKSEDCKAMRDEGWAVAKLDNKTALEQWKLERVMAVRNATAI